MCLLNRSIALLAWLVVISACRDRQSRDQAVSRQDFGQTAARCSAEVRRVVGQLGNRMRLVSLLAPDSVVQRELSDAYGGLVTGALLTSWVTNPALAPGRRVSSPWPARIDVTSIEAEDDHCVVKGSVVHVTTADTTSPVFRSEVTMRVVDERGWRVSVYDERSAAASETAASSPADVVRRYYSAIQAGDYDAAHAMWSEGGLASGKTRAEFAAGFSETEHVRLRIGDSVRVEGAAGSQYATVPVVIDAVLRDGSAQHFEGRYTLRRSMVDGATPDQRRWHIHAAHLRRN
jgi:hypothetical protein